MEKFKVDNNKIIFTSGKEIVFDFKIRHSLVFKNILIITLGILHSYEEYKRNIYGIDIIKEEMMWRLEDNERLVRSFDSPYILKNEVYVYGYPDIKIDPFTGKILKFIPTYK